MGELQDNMNGDRIQIPLDDNWKFHLGDIISIRNRWAYGKSGSWNQGPESIAYDDSEWQNVTLPHDFVIGTTPYEYNELEFTKDNTIPCMEDVGNIHTTAGSFAKNVGWYRKHFFIPQEALGKKVFLIFDGIYRNSQIILNEFLVSTESSGYTQIVVDITDTACYGGDNLLSIRTDATKAEGWFYEGGGIYRHAYLLITSPIRIEDLFIYSDVDYCHKSAKLSISWNFITECLTQQNTFGELSPSKTEEEYTLLLSVHDDMENELLSCDVSASSMRTDIQLSNIHLWSPEDPYLYMLHATLLDHSGRKIDSLRSRFGLRHIRFDSEEGFFLNGVMTKIKGVCCHQNHGGVGTAIPDELYRYRLLKLKEMGANGYRTSHYPPSPVLLDLCDELGFLVMDETRLLSSAPDDLHQLETMVKRDRNHPSVIMYCIGNEEAQSQYTPQGARIARTQINHIRQLDQTRPITMALLMLHLKTGERIKNPHWLDGIGNQLDVAGFNYNMDMWEPYREVHKGQPIISTEQGTFRSTRGCYETQKELCQISMTDTTDGQYMVGLERWHGIRNSWMSGQFLWTGFDYYGEPTPFKWPAISSQFGIMDLCGFPKDYYYYYKAWWNEEKPLVHICTNWNPLQSSNRNIHVFSNCREVELFKNGISLGRKKMEQDMVLIWENISFEPGNIEAVGYGSWNQSDNSVANDTILAKDSVSTTGPAVYADFIEEFSHGNLHIYRVEAKDSNGLLTDIGELTITLSAPNGKILGSSNGNPMDHDAPNGAVRKTFKGLAQFLVYGNTKDLTFQFRNR